MKRRNPPTAAQQPITNEKFIVGGAYAFLLRVSSFLGLAPLRFKTHANGYFVSISIPMCIYSYILMTVLATIAIFLMFSKGPYDKRFSIFTSDSTLSKAVLKCEMIFIIIKAATGVFGGPTRMRCMLKYMNAMSLVDQRIDTQYSQTKERRLRGGLVLFAFFISLLSICDILIATMVGTEGKWDILTYSVFFIIFCQIIVLQTQFAFTVMSVYTRFKAVNQILTIAGHLSVSYDNKVKGLDVVNIFAIRVDSNDAEYEIFVVRESGKKLAPSEWARIYFAGTGVPRPMLSGSLSDTVQRVAMIQGMLYDVVQDINKSYGLILVMMLSSLLINLISTVYFAILKMLSDADDLYYYEILKCLWFCLYLLNLFMLVEPCHYTIAEGKKTESLVNRMSMESPTSGALASRLELFSRQLMLQRIGYEPMGFFSLNRSLVVSMFEIMVTYLVILLQFRE